MVKNGFTVSLRNLFLSSTFFIVVLLSSCSDSVGPAGITPVGINCQVRSSSSILVAWSPVTGALSYVVYRGEAATGNYQEVGATADTSWIDTGLTTGSTYYYKVRATLEGGTTEFSDYALTTTLNSSSPSLARYQEVIDTVLRRVPILRGLPLVRPVRYTVISREDYAQQVQGNSQGNSDRDKYITTELVQMGVLGDTSGGYSQEQTDFTSTSAAAFYVPGTDSIFIIDAVDTRNFEFYFAHELTHALQDQNLNPFSSYVWPARSTSFHNSDFYFAMQCVYEGDATFDMYYYLYTYRSTFANPIAATVDDFQGQRDTFFLELGTPDTATPAVIGFTGYAPYVIGAYSMALCYQATGWAGVNNLYHSSRPTGTAEIITQNRVTPFAFNFSSLYQTLLSGTTALSYADDDNQGPIYLMAMLHKFVTPAQADSALGWQGDRILYLIKDNATYGNLVWAFACNTSENARSLYGMLDSLLTGRRLQRVTPVRIVLAGPDTGVSFTYPGLAGFTRTELSVDSNQVRWVENLADSQFTAVYVALRTQNGLAKSVAESFPTAGNYLSGAQKQKVNEFVMRKQFTEQ